MEAKYVTSSEATKEAIWLQKFLIDLEIVHGMGKAITLYCDNNVIIANTKETGNHKNTNNIVNKIMDVVKITFEDNLADSFTNNLLARSFEKHIERIGI
ncbi:hypothetical protein J1N35_034389 [Gossypium stocksii]|uniref:Reverse transcriptase Ty1/copia-type domain-containing protein n=1 Tax=Gossypium stocksii TaxID=47602 RepID=A0A9D3USS3_9ROSI|nr:hypothetical protein J1N35_034389 [Gossypium stocksii]